MGWAALSGDLLATRHRFTMHHSSASPVKTAPASWAKARLLGPVPGLGLSLAGAVPGGLQPRQSMSAREAQSSCLQDQVPAHDLK